MKNFVIVCATVCACAFAGPASAASMQVEQRVVSYADLDLSKPAGASILLSRLESASREVCGFEPDSRDLSGREHYAMCFKATMDASIRGVPSLLVKNLYMDTPHVSQEMASK